MKTLLVFLILFSFPAFAEGELTAPSYDVEQMIEPPAEGQPVKTPTLKVGDILNLKVIIPNPAFNGTKISLSPQKEWYFDPAFEIKRTEKGAEILFRATPLKPGKETIPSFDIQAEDGKAVGRTNPWTVDVQTAIPQNDPKPTEPVELRPPVSLDFPTWALVGIGILVLLLIAGIIYGLSYWSRNRKALAPKAAAARPSDPEDQVALAALLEIEKQAYMKKALHKPHYFGISETLKNYLGTRYRFDAAESTSYEMIHYLEDHKKLSDRELDQLESLFSRMDRVKFTDYIPDASEGQSVLEDARKLILATRRPLTPTVSPALPSAGSGVKENAAS